MAIMYYGVALQSTTLLSTQTADDRVCEGRSLSRLVSLIARGQGEEERLELTLSATFPIATSSFSGSDTV